MAAQSEDYILAKEWLSRLLSALSLTSSSLVVCPGNHDVQRKISQAYGTPSNNEEADRFLRVENYFQQTNMFGEYCRFYDSYNIPNYSMEGIGKSCLVGVRCVRGIKFICMNSAWFSQRKIVAGRYDDSNMLWLGLPILEYLESKGLLLDIEYNSTTPLTIVIFHHPFEVLHENERNGPPPRKSTKEYISYRSHIILTGHEHSFPRDPDQQHGRSHLLRGGATYENSKYENSFNLIRLDSDHYVHRAYIYRSGSSHNCWHKEIEKMHYYWHRLKIYMLQREIDKSKNEINDNVTSLVISDNYSYRPATIKSSGH
jgi:hypothetical protein